MEKFIDKLSSYNLFNHLFPGALFIIFINNFTPYSFRQENMILDIVLYYFVGLVLSRIGSLIIEPILRKIKFLKFTSHSEFLEASMIDSKIDILSETNNMYRTLSSTIIFLIMIIIYHILSLRYQFLSDWAEYIVLGFLLILFLYSYQKQTRYIFSRIKNLLSNKK